MKSTLLHMYTKSRSFFDVIIKSAVPYEKLLVVNLARVDTVHNKNGAHSTFSIRSQNIFVDFLTKQKTFSIFDNTCIADHILHPI